MQSESQGYVSAAGTAIHYRVFGTGSETVVLLPGWDNAPDEWGALLTDLVAAGYRAVWIDPRGTGLSDHPHHQWSMRTNARDVAAVVAQLGVARTDVIGYSYGGMIAQAFAASYPGSVRRLAIIDSAPPFPFRPPTRQGLQSMVHGNGSQPAGAPTSDHRRAILAILTARRGELRRITAATQVIHGTADAILPLRNGRMLGHAIRGAELRVIKGGTHDVLKTARGAHRVAALVIPFLRGGQANPVDNSTGLSVA